MVRILHSRGYGTQKRHASPTHPSLKLRYVYYHAFSFSELFISILKTV